MSSQKHFLRLPKQQNTAMKVRMHPGCASILEQKCRKKNYVTPFLKVPSLQVGTSHVRYLDLIVAAEAVKLVEQLKHSPLHLPVPRLFPPEPLRSDRVQLVDENDRPALNKTQERKKRAGRPPGSMPTS